MISRGAGVIIALTFLLAGVRASAQDPQGPQQRPPDSARRALLETEIRRGFARAVRERVQLSEEQMRRLAPVAQRYEQERRRLQIEERDIRFSLRAAVRDDTAADSVAVALLLQRIIDIQKRRVQLLESEQRDLAAIMTPVQRARYLALQEQIRRRMEQMRHRRMQGEGEGEDDVPAAGRRPSRPPL